MITVRAKCNVNHNGTWHLTGEIFDVSVEEAETLNGAQCVEVIRTSDAESESEHEEPVKEEKPKRSRNRKSSK